MPETRKMYACGFLVFVGLLSSDLLINTFYFLLLLVSALFALLRFAAMRASRRRTWT